jgi:hypothetical protein
MLYLPYRQRPQDLASMCLVARVAGSPKPKRPRKSTADAAPSQIAAPADVTAKKHVAPTPGRNASDAEIQSAKDGGKVWVNTQSGVYHNGGK